MRRSLILLISMVLVVSMLFGSVSCKDKATVEEDIPEDTEEVQSEEESVVEETSSLSGIDEWYSNIKSKYEGITLGLAFGTHPSTEAFQKMADEFTAKTGIELHFDVMENVALIDKQLLEFTGHTGAYDVLMMDSFALPEFASKEIVIPLDDYLSNSETTPEWFDYEDILPAFRNGLGKYENVAYGIPTAGESRFLAYRKDLFEKYNQNVPTTLDELLEVSEFFNGKEEDLYGMALRAQKGVVFASGWATFVYNFGDGFVDQNTWESRMNSEDVKESLDYFIRLLETCPPDVLNYTHEEATSVFVSGKTAMWFDATALVPWLEDPDRSQIAGKIGYAGPPPGPAGEAGMLAGWNLAISADSKNKEAAWAFIVYMTSKAMAPTYIENGGIPSRISVLSDSKFIEENPSAEAQIAAFDAAQALIDRGLDSIPRTPALGKILDRIGYYGALPIVENESIDEAMDMAHEEITEILEEVK